MGWFVAEAIFVSDIADSKEQYDPLIEDCLFLVNAASDEEAKHKAEAVALTKQDAYENSSGETVRWKFVNIVRVREVLDEQLREGTEVWCTIQRRSEQEETHHRAS